MTSIRSIFLPHKQFLNVEVASENKLFELVVDAEFRLNKLKRAYPLGHICRRLTRTPVSGEIKFSKSLIPTFLALFRLSLSKTSWLRGKGKVLLIQNSKKYHFRSLIEPLTVGLDQPHDLAVVSENTFNGKKLKKLNGNMTPALVLGALLFTLTNVGTIKKELARAGIVIPTAMAMNEVFIQMVSYRSIFNWLKNSSYNLILVDSDRTNFISSLSCAAANRLNIASASLQHGVIDMGFGYYPLIADEIWCWGRFSQQRLASFGLAQDRIKIVGNPTAKLKVQGNKEARFVIGFGFSGHSPEKERKMVEGLLETATFADFKIMLKLRPSIAPDPWMNEHPRLQVYHTEAKLNANELFFKEVDVLITTVSSIGPEAVVSGAPVWIYRLTENPERFDNLLINTGVFPDITEKESFEKEIGLLFEEKAAYLRKILTAQLNFVTTEFYNVVGEKASDNIRSDINKKTK